MEKKEFVMLEDLPWAVQSWLIINGVTSYSNGAPNYEILKKGLDKLYRNRPSLRLKCEEYLEMR